MAKAKDLIGQKFGKLMVIKRNGSDKHGKALWLCKCECGNEVSIRGSRLISGYTKSCGCLKHECLNKNNNINIDNLVNKRFGRLTVISRNGSDKYGNSMWLCRCDCGNETTVRANSLKNGSTKSCGCLKHEIHERHEYLKCGERTKKYWQNEEYRKAHSGENHWNYNKNITNEERERRKYKRQGNTDFKKWSKEIKERANFTCDCCGKRGCKLHSHHLNSWNTYKEQRYDLENGVCLCEHCHKEFHHIYGQGDNTKEQYIEFKENKQT